MLGLFALLRQNPSLSSNCLIEAGAARCSRCHSCIGSNTAVSVSCRVTSCRPSAMQVSSNSLNRAFAS